MRVILKFFYDRFVIYIKCGVYFENIEILREKMMIMFFGDGIGQIVIKVNCSGVDGWIVFNFVIVGKFF